MNTRTIYYIDEHEDRWAMEAGIALSGTMKENLKAFCQVIAANFAMMNIDVANYPAKKVIYYTEDERDK